MSAFARIKSFMTAFVRNRRVERDMEDEWRFHVEARLDALIASGLSRADAQRRARREFGDPLRWKEQGREARGLCWLHETSSDVQYALRQMRRTPVFAAVAITTLALGIGANTAIFSIVNGLLLRPLPVDEPDRLAAVGTVNDVDEVWTFAVWDAIRQRASAFDGAFAFGRQRFDLAISGETDPVEGIYATGDFFTVLGVPALVGRTFTSGDDVIGGGPSGPVAVISYGFWRRRFGGEAKAIGTQLVVQRVPFTIIGVTPPEFFGAEVGREFDVALPLNAEPLIRGKDTALDRERGNYSLRIMLRLKPDQSIAAAETLLRSAQAQIREDAVPRLLPPDLKAKFLADPFVLVPAGTGLSPLRRQYERPLLAILTVVGIVLLIACANLANLLLARAAARRHEFSVRLALGSGPWRLARQLLVEAIVLAAVGAAAGTLLAAWTSRILVAQLSTADSRVALDVPIDPRVLAFTTILTLATAFVFGIAPALRATRLAPVDMMNERGRGILAGRQIGLSSGLVIAQVALSLVLVVAAGLFVRTLVRLSTVRLGFDSHRILIVNVDVTRAAVPPDGRLRFFAQAADAIASLPGVEHAAASIITPVGGGGVIDDVEVTGGSPVAEGESTYGLPRFWNVNSSMLNYVTSDWFATYGMTVHRGRGFTENDTATAVPVAVVNDAFARKFLRGRDPIGAAVTHRIAAGSTRGMTRTIVGVVDDAVYDSLRGGVRPVLFVPLAQVTLSGRTTLPLSVTSAAESPAALAPLVSKTLTTLDRNVAFSFRPLQDRVNATFIQERLLALLSGFFGMLALLLAGIGLYGVTAYGVSRQRGEIGVRLALGAQRGHIVRQVLGRVLVLVAAGIIAGAVASMWLSRYVQTLLFGLEPRDLTTLISATVILAAVGALAGWLPAYRASRIDPAEVLREN